MPEKSSVPPACSAERKTANVLPFSPIKTKSRVCLRDAVDQCLERYFANLAGMSPPPDFYQRVLEHVERPLIEHVLRYVHGNQLRAATVLGINRNTLRKKITQLGINVQQVVSKGE